MTTTCELSMQHRNLQQQGYKDYNSEQLRQIDMGLRFTPATCSLIAIYGLVIQSPAVLFTVAFLGVLAFFFPAGHPMDLFYNKVIAKALKAEPLPPNPLQRRLACFAAGIMNSMAAIFFIVSLPMAAYITGGMLMILQAIVIFTHFCTLSWMYEKVLKFFGSWSKPVDEALAKQLIQEGALLIDVRGPDEFSKGHLNGAINVPLDNIETQVEEFKECKVMLYCASGMRSQMAKQKLTDAGLTQVFDLGGKNRAAKLFA
ncbi:MAG: DUF4395 family protein [Enterobacterales bacterium]|nr:DUF4395 family protein [Enterobacterales bacterium]